MVVVAIVMVLTLALSAGTASAAPGWGGGNRYVVRPGDTLTSIAFMMHVSPFELARANGIANPNLIFVGECLMIPECGPQFPAPVFNRGPVCEPQCDWNPCYTSNYCDWGCNNGGNWGCDNGCNQGCDNQGWGGGWGGYQAGWGGWGYQGCQECQRPFQGGQGRGFEGPKTLPGYGLSKKG